MAMPTPLFVLRGHRSPIHTITFEPETNVVERSVSASEAAAIQPQTINAADSSAIVASLAHPITNTSHRIHQQRLYSGDASGQVMIWDLNTRRAITKLPHAHTQPVLALASLSDGKLISQGKDGLVKVWDLNHTEAPLITIETNSYTFFKMQCMELSTNQTWSLPPTNQSRLEEERKSEDTENEISSRSTSSSSTTAEPSLFSSSSPLLLLPCEEASNMSLYDLRVSSLKPIQLIECEKRIPRDMDAEAGFRSRLSEAELKEADALLDSLPPTYDRKVGMCMAARFFQPQVTSDQSAASSSQPISLDHLNICWASESGIIGVWDVRGGKHLFQQSVHKDTILSFDLNWSGRYGVSCSSGSDILTWTIDMVNGRISELGRINVPHEGLAEVVLRADGQLFATGGWDHRVRLFDSLTLQPLAILREHTDTVQCVAMPTSRTPSTTTSTSNGFLASGAKDGKIAVYQLYPDATATQSNDQTKLSILQQHQQLYAQRHPNESTTTKQLTTS